MGFEPTFSQAPIDSDRFSFDGWSDSGLVIDTKWRWAGIASVICISRGWEIEMLR